MWHKGVTVCEITTQRIGWCRGLVEVGAFPRQAFLSITKFCKSGGNRNGKVTLSCSMDTEVLLFLAEEISDVPQLRENRAKIKDKIKIIVIKSKTTTAK